MESHGATVYTSNTTGAAWKPFKLSLEIQSHMEPHGPAWSSMELPYKRHILQKPRGDPLNEV